MFSALIGSVSFSGSLAFGKLQGSCGTALLFRGQRVMNGIVLGAALAFAVAGSASEEQVWMVLLLVAALVFGVMLVLPIGGADMPVVISFLNAFTGLAAASTGFVLDNAALIIGGTLVGASGAAHAPHGTRDEPLARERALQRLGAAPAGGPAVGGSNGHIVREITADDAAVMLAYARQVVVVPGYGLAVAHAQRNARSSPISSRARSSRPLRHPSRGRADAGTHERPPRRGERALPAAPRHGGCEPGVPANGRCPRDRCERRHEPGRADESRARSTACRSSTSTARRNVIVLKRSMNPGFAGIDNELYYNPKTAMLFGAKASVESLVGGVKNA